jgi:tetratricopeptide (TPR) repeat protein
MRQVTALGCVLACVLTAGVAGASEQSKLLYSRGLVDLHADRFEKALELFNQAVTADPSDIYARYYRAVTRGRLNDVEGAITDLRAVLAEKPDLEQAQLDLGVALVQSGQYREAIPWLEQAQHARDLDAQASLFLGIAQLRLGELAPAQAGFERAQARDPKQALAARYYLGIVAYQRGKLSAAEDHFTSVAQASPDTDMGREAKTFLEKIDALQARWQYQVYAALGLQYDSNVPLLNNAITSRLSTIDDQQGDGATTINFGGTYVPWQNDFVTLSLGYDFFQSVHFTLSGFNLQDHGPSVQAAFNTGSVQYGILGRYDYYILENNSFLQEATALPWLTIPEEDLGRFEFYSRMRRRDFKNAAYFVLDSWDYAVGIRQVFYLDSPNRYFSVGYQFDRNDPVIKGSLQSTADEEFGANSYGYDGQEVNLGAGWLLPQSITATGTFAYRNERYQLVQNDDGPDRRKDNEYLVTVALSRPLTEHLNVTLSYLGDFNDSNNSFFEYDRSIVSAAMEVRF